MPSSSQQHEVSVACRQLEDAAHRFTEHAAAVKAIAWCPHQRKVLASGGGEADHHVRVWDTNAGSQLAAIDAKSQVCLCLLCCRRLSNDFEQDRFVQCASRHSL